MDNLLQSVEHLLSLRQHGRGWYGPIRFLLAWTFRSASETDALTEQLASRFQDLRHRSDVTLSVGDLREHSESIISEKPNLLL